MDGDFQVAAAAPAGSNPDEISNEWPRGLERGPHERVGGEGNVWSTWSRTASCTSCMVDELDHWHHPNPCVVPSTLACRFSPSQVRWVGSEVWTDV